jgi:hypothetical protein
MSPNKKKNPKSIRKIMQFSQGRLWTIFQDLHDV